MIITKATADDMLSLWGYESLDKALPTARFFADNISSGNALFWAMDEFGEIIGELYAFLNLDDKDFADGKQTAYLCAFRIKKGFRGQGLGSKLMKRAFMDLEEMGFHTVTIGVDCTEEQNIRLYHRLGFTDKIKDCHEDPCDVDENLKPKSCDCFWLIKRSLC